MRGSGDIENDGGAGDGGGKAEVGWCGVVLGLADSEERKGKRWFEGGWCHCKMCGMEIVFRVERVDCAWDLWFGLRFLGDLRVKEVRGCLLIFHGLCVVVC